MIVLVWLTKWNSNWRSSRHPLRCILWMGFPIYHIVSKRHASSTKELEKKGGFVSFYLKGNGMHFEYGIHYP
jgi:hypothetical protein